MATRDRIVDAAATVLRERGLAHATTREIARAAGLSEAALYKYFPGKEALLLSVVRERLPELIPALLELPQRAGQGTVAANLTDITMVALAFYRELVPMLGAMFAEPELLARHQEVLREHDLGPHLAPAALAGYLRAEQQQGRVAAGMDTSAAAALLLGACMQRGFFATFVGPRGAPGDDADVAAALVAEVLRA